MQSNDDDGKMADAEPIESSHTNEFDDENGNSLAAVPNTSRAR